MVSLVAEHYGPEQPDEPAAHGQKGSQCHHGQQHKAQRTGIHHRRGGVKPAQQRTAMHEQHERAE